MGVHEVRLRTGDPFIDWLALNRVMDPAEYGFVRQQVILCLVSQLAFPARCRRQDYQARVAEVD